MIEPMIPSQPTESAHRSFRLTTPPGFDKLTDPGCTSRHATTRWSRREVPGDKREVHAGHAPLHRVPGTAVVSVTRWSWSLDWSLPARPLFLEFLPEWIGISATPSVVRRSDADFRSQDQSPHPGAGLRGEDLHHSVGHRCEAAARRRRGFYPRDPRSDEVHPGSHAFRQDRHGESTTGSRLHGTATHTRNHDRRR